MSEQEHTPSKVEMCKNYTTSGFPRFKPKCKFSWALAAGLHCHSSSTHCEYYNKDKEDSDA